MTYSFHTETLYSIYSAFFDNKDSTKYPALLVTNKDTYQNYINSKCILTEDTITHS